MYFIYVLQSQKDKQLYVGFTMNLDQRIAMHNRGGVTSTKSRTPLELIFYEAYKSKNDALRREKYLKTTVGKRGLKLMLREALKSG